VTSTAYIVDVDKGDDANTGFDESEAFKSIQRCIEALQQDGVPGDECQIRSGRYLEALNVTGLRGTKEEPFVIRGYQNEEPIWDGTVPLKPSKWNLDEETGICSSSIDEDIFALFLDDDLLTAACWPNALWSDKTIFNNTYWGQAADHWNYGNMTDDGQQGLADSGINATGAMAILNIGSFNTYVRPVLHHEPGSPSFTYNHDMGTVHSTRYDQYYLEASLELLDAPGEWFFDKYTKQLHLILPNGGCPDPQSDSLRGRTIDYGLHITNTTGLTIGNISFMATNIHAHSVDFESQIDYIKLDSLIFKFPSSSHRMLGDSGEPLETKLLAKCKMHKGKMGNHWAVGTVSVVNCTFEGSEGPALIYDGNSNFIHNNLFSYNDWACQATYGGGTVHGLGNYEVFSQNTFWYNGHSAGIRPGLNALIEGNHVIGQCSGRIQNDGAGIHIQVPQQNNVTIYHNWVRNSPKFGIRFDGGGHQLGHGGHVAYNVGQDTSAGIMIKGDNHTINNNIAIQKNTDQCSLCVIYILRNDGVIENNNSIVLNNGATKASGGRNLYDGGDWPLAGKVVENNYSGEDAIIQMVDTENLDFRPTIGKAFTTGEELIGAYQPGSSGTYWIPGRKEYKTTMPIPLSGSIIPPTRDVVICLGGYMADEHHFYFGNERDLVESAEMEDEEFQFALAANEGNMFQLPKLISNTQYFWRVDVQNGGYIYKGDVWSFFTSSIHF
ncbi:unnamed protein product, partial [Meganyctiphanes norvegica]